MYESTDNGKTFHKNKSLQATPFTVEGIIYGYNKVVYVTTVNGLYESTDNGKTFHKNTSISAGVASMYGLKKTIYATAYDGGL